MLAYTTNIGGEQEPRLVGFYDNSYVTDLASTPNSIIPGPGVSGPGSRLRKEGGDRLAWSIGVAEWTPVRSTLNPTITLDHYLMRPGRISQWSS